ncbi:NAD(P)/FAD-dependent oxidoreductase [Mahella sp.]|uniref:NAD(P)/FAD-dependent oxidoreductase n=1 Tax=Mahella sp. TaxID=2798721 RepID=UPI0025BEA327|nr:NAD(P)/FAD-dependent oxidoreductase [Mahella sp.]MBZ4665657.1 dependent oxidoreductase [Mahella sp.]
MYDVVIIGAGVVGSCIARELSRYELSICLLDKEWDVASGTSKGNSAIVHAGYDAKPGTLQARLNVKGNELMEQWCTELDVPFKRVGSLLLAFNDDDMGELYKLMEQGRTNGVPELRIIYKDELHTMEHHISGDAIAALYAPTAGVVCPYELTIAAAENAVINGADIRLGQTVQSIMRDSDSFEVVTTEHTIRARYVIDAAGVYADDIASMIGDNSFKITPRKGEYCILDKAKGYLAKHVIFQPPTAMGKGVLVTPTVDGNILVGPNAHDVNDKEDMATTAEGLQEIMDTARKSVPAVSERDVITSFAGLRAVSGDDFVIKPSDVDSRFIIVGGICSPGLTSAPAIALMVTEFLHQAGLIIDAKADYNPIRKGIPRFREMNEDERRRLIAMDPAFGRVICRCETVTEGEIIEAVNRPIPAVTLDAIKRRARAGMGRCQSGFCTPRVMEIISKQKGIPVDGITKKGGRSIVLTGVVQKGDAYDDRT